MLSCYALNSIAHVQPLVSAFSERYSLETESLMRSGCFEGRSALMHQTSRSSRLSTCEKISPSIIKEQCRLAAIRAQDLFIKDKRIDLSEMLELERLGNSIFSMFFEFYRNETPAAFFNSENIEKPQQYTINFFYLADRLDEIIGEFWRSENLGNIWQVYGFITTEVNLSVNQLKPYMTPAEQLLIEPYFRFMEDHIVLPWQKLCFAAVNHSPDSPKLALVEHMIPLLDDISTAAFRKWSMMFPS